MLILVSQLQNRPVVTFDGAQSIGILRDPIIDPDNGKIVGYFFGHGLLFLKQGVILTPDIVGYDETRVVVQHADVVRAIAEEPKLKKIIQRKIPVLGAKVITESGKHLGRADDLLIDTELHMVIRYYTRGLMTDRIIAAEHVNRIEKRGIIVDDMAQSAASMAEAEAEPTA